MIPESNYRDITIALSSEAITWLNRLMERYNAERMAYKFGGKEIQSAEWDLVSLASAVLETHIQNERYEEQRERETHERVERLLNTPFELPPYEPVPVPEWLTALEREVSS